MFAFTENDRPNSNDALTVDRITIRSQIDTNPDLSFLTADSDEDRRTARSLERRLRAYRRGDWEMIGVWAECIVSYPISSRGDRRLETLRSGGLWGVESDSDPDYLSDVQQAQVLELRQHAERFGVDVESFDRCVPVTRPDDVLDNLTHYKVKSST